MMSLRCAGQVLCSRRCSGPEELQRWPSTSRNSALHQTLGSRVLRLESRNRRQEQHTPAAVSNQIAVSVKLWVCAVPLHDAGRTPNSHGES